jgi:fructose-1,6-bisphosphatase/sedoheptulose 1,7-bisphosphatase-like protein
MDKIIVGPAARNAVDIEASPADNLKAIARSLGRDVDDLVVMVLDRPRHEQLIADIRKAGARIKLISDGDLSAGISAAVRGTNVHAVMGTGGAPEGVLAAAALRCLNGGKQGRLVLTKEGAEKEKQIERMRQMGITDLKRVYTERDLAPGPEILFVASGVTDGPFMRGVRFFGGGPRVTSLVMSRGERLIRFIDSVHTEEGADIVVEF